MALGAMVLLVAACDDDNGGASVKNTGDYAVSVRTEGTDGSTDYVLQVEDLMSGTISVEGQGFEQDYWCYYTELANSIFAITYGATEGNLATAYTRGSDGILYARGQIAFERMDINANVNDTLMIGVGADHTGANGAAVRIMEVDGKNLAITDYVDYNLYDSYDGDDINEWPTGAVVRDGKLFVPFYPLDGPTWETPYVDSAYVSIFEYPSLEFVETIKDNRTGPIGAYGGQHAVFTDDDDNIYMISVCALSAGFTESTRNSGLLRINDGETTFDDEYFFDFESEMDATLLNGTYVGDGKAMVQYISNDYNDAYSWAGLTASNPYCKLAILDLEAKTITEVSGVPDHGVSSYRYLVENGSAYVTIRSAEETRVYAIDLTTGVGTSGALVQAAALPFMAKLDAE